MGIPTVFSFVITICLHPGLQVYINMYKSIIAWHTFMSSKFFRLLRGLYPGHRVKEMSWCGWKTKRWARNENEQIAVGCQPFTNTKTHKAQVWRVHHHHQTQRLSGGFWGRCERQWVVHRHVCQHTRSIHISKWNMMSKIQTWYDFKIFQTYLFDIIMTVLWL